MAFGKRGPGDPPPRRPAANEAGESVIETPVGPVRTVVVNKPASVDKGFIALAAGVVLLAGGGAMAAPGLFSLLGGGVRPIADVVKGLDRDGVRAAMLTQAFPDADGAAFMTSLATTFPRAHDKLVDMLADAAMAGGDRDALFVTFNAWSADFALSQKDVVARTGAEGFDKAVALLGDGMQFLEAESGGCTVASLRAYMERPTLFADLTKYDSRAYHFNMRFARDIVDLAAKGRNARPVETRLTANDNNALQATFFSMLSDPQVSSLMQVAMASGNSRDAQMAVAEKLNVCQLGRSILIKFEGLPEGTKTRLFGSLLSGDLGKGFDMNAMSAPFGQNFGGQNFGGNLSFRP